MKCVLVFFVCACVSAFLHNFERCGSLVGAFLHLTFYVSFYYFSVCCFVTVEMAAETEECNQGWHKFLFISNFEVECSCCIVTILVATRPAGVLMWELVVLLLKAF